MLPEARPLRKTVPRKSGYRGGPQNTSSAETRVTQWACKKIKAHLKTAKSFKRYRARLIRNKYGVTVTSVPVSIEERICLTVYEKKKVVALTVRNSGVSTVYLTFRASALIQNVFTVRDCHGNIIETVKKHRLRPGEVYKIQVHFCSEHAGFYEQLLFFEFETHERSTVKFEIIRLLEVIRRTSLSEELLPTETKSLSNHQKEKWFPDSGGSRSPPFVVPLLRYPVPDNITDLGRSDRALWGPLNWENYPRRLSLMLHLEEFQSKTEIKKHMMSDVLIFRHESNPYIFLLQIAGVSENLPHNLTQNEALVTFSPPINQTYQGWVLSVNEELIYVRFKDLKSSFKDGTRVSVSFAINRTPLRIQHRAANGVYLHRFKEVLFPTGRLSSQQSDQQSLSEVAGNPEQRTAVQHIVACSAKPAPYLVFGPPGTGKTVTLVEAIKQIVKTHPSCNILACAPSNSAADHLCLKILEGIQDKLTVYRLYALSCPVTNIPQFEKFCSNLNYKLNTYESPSLKELMKYKIMVCTLVTSGSLISVGIPAGHYDYIFVDEAGQARETECIIPIAGLMKTKSCQLVLAGDPKQLGPIISSTMAVKHGMGLSLLERLMMDNKLYKPDETNGYNNHFVTKLLRNYRSHPAILKIPNELFYGGQLQAYANKEKNSLYCKWEHLPKKGFPLIFHGVAGTDERDANSPSVYNMAEVEVLKEYLKALVNHLHRKGVTKIEPGEIGVIAPYRKQVEKIRKALQTDKDLRKEDLKNVLVDTVEKFQGQEFNVILVSTVRSIPKLTAHSQRFTLGFVNNEKRFNVALTRARALLIVVGDPRALKTEPVWNRFVNYCYKEGGYRGLAVFDAEEKENEKCTLTEPLWSVIQQELDPF